MRRAVLAPVALAALLCCCVSGASTAAAQDIGCSPNEAQFDHAIDLFRQGTDHVQNFRWSDAVPLFEEAYRLTCRSAALYNLGMAQRALGRHREARDTFGRLLENHSDIEADLRFEVTEIRREEAARVSILQLLGISRDVRPDITFDGREVSAVDARPIEIETDAGNHSLVAQIPDHEPFLWDGELTDGQRQSIEIDFQPLPVGAEPGDSFDPTWLIVGLALAAAAGIAIGVGFYLYEDSILQPNHPSRTSRLEPM